MPELFARLRRDVPRVELKILHAGMMRLEEFVIDGRVDVALLSELSRSRLVASTRLAEEEMVLVTRPGARMPGIVEGEELGRTPLVLGDGLRAAMDGLLAGRGIELKVEIEINDNETMRLMVQQGVAASISALFVGGPGMRARPPHGIPHHRRAGSSAPWPWGSARAARLHWRAKRSIRTLSEVVAEMAQDGRLALGPQRSAPRPAPRVRAAS